MAASPKPADRIRGFGRASRCPEPCPENALQALYDLTHETTTTERLALMAQARIVEPLDRLTEQLGELIHDLLAAARDRQRERVH